MIPEHNLERCLVGEKGDTTWRCKRCHFQKGEEETRFYPEGEPTNSVCTSCLVEMVLFEFDALVPNAAADCELIEQAVRRRNGGRTLWGPAVQDTVMRQCGRCAERYKRICEAVRTTPLPTFTMAEIHKALNDREITGFTLESFDKHVTIKRAGGGEVRGTLVEESDG